MPSWAVEEQLRPGEGEGAKQTGQELQRELLDPELPELRSTADTWRHSCRKDESENQDIQFPSQGELTWHNHHTPRRDRTRSTGHTEQHSQQH